MAFVSKEKKSKISAELKSFMPKSWKYSLAVNHHSTIVMTIAAAPIDLLTEIRACRAEQARKTNDTPYEIKGSADVNPYHYEKQFADSLPIIARIIHALNTDNHDRSDSQSDYFDVGHYVELQIGRWNKPFVFTGDQNHLQEAA